MRRRETVTYAVQSSSSCSGSCGEGRFSLLADRLAAVFAARHCDEAIRSRFIAAWCRLLAIEPFVSL